MVVALLLLWGCTTVQRASLPPDALQDGIRAGELVKAGDRIAVLTVSRGEREFVVTDVGEDVIRGDGEEVSIDDVVGLEVRKVAPGRTALAVFGGVYVVVPLTFVGLSILGAILGL